MNIGRSLYGLLEVELTSAELESTLSFINDQGIEINRLKKQDELSCRFIISRKYDSRLRTLAEKCGARLRIIKYVGLFWKVKQLYSRPILWGGIIFFFVLSLYLPRKILFVQVDGNSTIPNRRILAAAESSGVSFGTSRKDIRSEKIKNAILADIPQLQWVGVNTAGCVATVSVRERSVSDQESEEIAVSRIVAARDGYILSGTVVQGNALFEVGQTVRQGQVLISGYRDGGFCIRATRAKGEVYAQTSREISAITPSSYLVRGEKQDSQRSISIIFRKKRINLWKDSGISDATCGRMYKEFYVTLPGGFQLPIALCIETITTYTVSDMERDRDKTQEALKDFAHQQLNLQMIAGAIHSGSEVFSDDNGRYQLRGQYICVEMIGREQQEQIGDTNGKNG